MYLPLLNNWIYMTDRFWHTLLYMFIFKILFLYKNKRYISKLYRYISTQSYLVTKPTAASDKVIIRKQLVLQPADFSVCVRWWWAGSQNTVSTVYSPPPYSSLTQGVYAGHGHKLQFLAMTFINSYKYDSCCFFFFFSSRHGKWNHLISFT